MAEAERSQEAVEQFWNDYFKAETENYKKLLNEHDKLFSGKVSELTDKLDQKGKLPTSIYVLEILGILLMLGNLGVLIVHILGIL